MVSTLEHINAFYGKEEERLKTSKKNCVEFAKTLDAYRHALDVMRASSTRLLEENMLSQKQITTMFALSASERSMLFNTATRKRKPLVEQENSTNQQENDEPIPRHQTWDKENEHVFNNEKMFTDQHA